MADQNGMAYNDTGFRYFKTEVERSLQQLYRMSRNNENFAYYHQNSAAYADLGNLGGSVHVQGSIYPENRFQVLPPVNQQGNMFMTPNSYGVLPDPAVLCVGHGRVMRSTLPTPLYVASNSASENMSASEQGAYYNDKAPFVQDDLNSERLPKNCNFCKKNGETYSFYTSHDLKDEKGRVLCPVLRKYVCPICGSTGDEAHTVSHCKKKWYSDSVRPRMRNKICRCRVWHTCGVIFKR